MKIHIYSTLTTNQLFELYSDTSLDGNTKIRMELSFELLKRLEEEKKQQQKGNKKD